MAIDAARKVAEKVRLEQIEQFPTVEFFKTIPILALTQFGRWEEVLDEPEPPANLDYSTAIWHYARGTALINKGDIQGALAERAALVLLRESVQVSFLDNADYPASTLLLIADELLMGDIAMARGQLNAAIERFSQAVKAQDGLPYMEPPFWYYPTRQSLGMSLLKARRYAEAEAVYRRDLEAYPRNGWSLFGLIQSLEAQDKMEEAESVRHIFDQVWSQADVELTGSRI